MLGRYKTASLIGCAVVAMALLLGSHQALAQKKIRIGTIYNLALAPTWVAVDEGYFKAEGIDAEILGFGGGPELRTAVLSGSVEFITGAVDATMSLHERGQPLMNVVGLSQGATDALVMRKDLIGAADKKDPKSSLKGKTIGVATFGSGSDLKLRTLLASLGLNPASDVKILATGTDIGAGPLMTQGRIDAMFGLEPGVSTITTGQAAPGAVFLDCVRGECYQGAEITPVGALQTTPAFIQKDPEIVAAVVRAQAKASHAIRRDPSLLVKAVKKALPNIAPDVLDAAIKRQLASITPEISREGFDALSQAQVRSGLLKKGATPYEAVVPTQFVPLWKADTK